MGLKRRISRTERAKKAEICLFYADSPQKPLKNPKNPPKPLI
jgi:hypothetical protein